MPLRRFGAAAALLSLLLTGCASSGGSPPAAPVQAPQVTAPVAQGPSSTAPPAQTPGAQQPTPNPQAPAGLREKAMVLLGNGNPKEAVPLLQQLVAQEPTADNYNDLSYALLLVGENKSAKEAADKAIQLRYEHPGAHYNAGMASLALGELHEAQQQLALSAQWQPDRYEPELGLALVYLKQRNETAAAYHLEKAARLAPEADDVIRARTELAALRQAAPKEPPDGYPASCKAQLTDGAVTLCLYGQSIDLTLYAIDGVKTVTGQHPVQRGATLEKVALPGGQTGYWLISNAPVIDEFYHSLWILREGRPIPVIFAGSSEGGMEIRAISKRPTVKGDLILGNHFNAARTEVVHNTWKLSADLTVATLVETKSLPKGK